MQIQKAPNINSLWGALIIEELIRNGVEYFCIAPGSRSAPLTAAAAYNSRAKNFVHFDERGLAFHALGFVSATRKPAALICTSGTAVANFFPAIIETSKKKLPLIVLTADRPPELLKSGADQVIDQAGIYGRYAKWDFTFPCPTKEIKPEFVLTTIDQAVYQAKSGMPGVIHLNCMFREPLTPKKTGEDFTEYLKGLGFWVKGKAPYTTYLNPNPLTLNPESLNPQILQALSQIKNGLIAVGKLSSQEEGEAVLRLARHLGWPIFADITSGLRLGSSDEAVIHYYSQLLLTQNAEKKFKFDGILHLGGRMCAKRYYHFVQHLKPKHYITVLAHPLRNDPLHKVTLRIQSSAKEFCESILSRQSPVASRQYEILKRLKELNDATDKKIENFVRGSKVINEIAAARIVSRLIPKNSGLFLASSMPIRDMDMFAAHDGNPVVVGSNRGASGIDGTIASAVGFAKALNRPTTLVVGDLAFLHDLNSLSMAKSLANPFIIVLLNNNGGGIFNFLPIAEHKDIFEKFFATPHNLDLKSVGEMFGLELLQVKSISDFERTYKNALKGKQVIIIEVKTQRVENTAQHRSLQKISFRSLIGK